MNEEEKKAVERFKRLYLKDFNNEKITNEDRLSYIECVLISNLIEKLQKENEELREKWDKDTHILQNELDLTNADKINNYIPIQKIKDKIEELKINLVNMQGEELLIYESKIDVLQELLESEEIEMEEKYINKILNFADENINTAKELVINKEQANGIIKELQEDYTPNAIIRLKIAEYKERKAKCNDIETEVRLDVKIRAYEELLEKRK